MTQVGAGGTAETDHPGSKGQSSKWSLRNLSSSNVSCTWGMLPIQRTATHALTRLYDDGTEILLPEMAMWWDVCLCPHATSGHNGGVGGLLLLQLSVLKTTGILVQDRKLELCGRGREDCGSVWVGWGQVRGGKGEGGGE